MVADGMGGHAAGEVASRLAVEVDRAFINDTRDADINTHLAVSRTTRRSASTATG